MWYDKGGNHNVYHFSVDVFRSLPLKSKETPAPILKHQYGSADNITQSK